MLAFIADRAVPACLFILMLVAGTEIGVSDLRGFSRHGRAVLLGSLGQLLALPLVALLIHQWLTLHPIVIQGTMLLSLCPNGGISNYYVYLARCNVWLSATITAAGTVFSIATIPLWLKILPSFSPVASEFAGVPARTMLIQLVALMVVPMAIGMTLRLTFRERIERAEKALRWFSIAVVIVILVPAIASVVQELSGHLADIAMAASLFIVSAMLLGRAMGHGLPARDRPVLVIEAAVRNVGVALILGNAMLSRENFGIFASFIAGYFVVEMAIMLGFARWQARRTS